VTPGLSSRSLFLLTFLLTAVVGSLQATAAYACTGTVTVSPTDTGSPLPPSGPAPGTSLDVVGDDFTSGPVLVHWGSVEGPVLGKAVADRSGDFALRVVVPAEPGDRPRIVARSTAGSSNGMPSMGWADLWSDTAQTTAPAVGQPEAAVGEPASPQLRNLGDAAAALVLVLGAGLLAAVFGRRHRTRPGMEGTTDGTVPFDDDLERELAEVVAGDDRTSGIRVQS
jgi:hypothetical protein